MREDIASKIDEYHAALLDNAKLAAQENTLKIDRQKARIRLNIAKDSLRALEEDVQYLLELKVINQNVEAKALAL